MHLERVDIWREEQHGEGPQGEMRMGDVLELLPSLVEEYAGKVQLIYLDPPFGTGHSFSMRVRVGEKEWKTGSGSLVMQSYEDDLNVEAYMSLMREVITASKKLLSDTGVVYLHVDYRMHARLRILMDEIFGEQNFLNEIIWSYQTGGRARKFFSRKHDIILFYRKTKKYYFNLEAVPVNRVDVRRNHMKRHVDPDGRVYRSIRSGGKIYTYYDDDPTFPGEVWDDVSHLQQKDPQRTGYETQKPVKLLERIILSSSAPGDLICDLFVGSGTALEAATMTGRRFLGVDLNPFALQVTRRRLTGRTAAFVAPPCQGEPEIEASVTPGIAYYDVSLDRYQPEAGVSARAFQDLDAVDSWSVGYLRDGVFLAMAHDVRLRHAPALKRVLQLPVLEGQPCIRVGDVLGRYFYYVFTPEGV